MGCLNSGQGFSHWFSNIHLSGACNRSCYFCIGQHMMALDPFDNLSKKDLDGFDEFISKCKEHNIGDVNLTGSNTDPLLYQHHEYLIGKLRELIPGVRVGLRTNGALALKKKDIVKLYDKMSVSVTTLNPELYVKTMGQGTPPDLKQILQINPEMDVKINVVLCPESIESDIYDTLKNFQEIGIKRVNIREPYGQPHIGNPFFNPTARAKELGIEYLKETLGMQTYSLNDMEITYWDVHYVEVESVNLYANGVVSVDYPVTRGHDPIYGDVRDQSKYEKSGRVREQWLSTKKKLKVV